MNKIIEKYIKKLRSPKALMAIGIAGIVLIFFSSVFSDNGEVKSGEEAFAEITAEQYREELEEALCKAVREITGSKRVTAVVTLESGVRYSYADTREQTSAEKQDSEEKSSDTELKEGYITVKSADGGEQALLVTEQMPEVRGVAIVCEGGDNEILREKIENAVTAALNITSKRVYICGRQ